MSDGMSAIAALIVRELFGYSYATWRFHLRGEAIRGPHDQLAQRGIAQICEVDLVKLQVAAAGIGEAAHDLAIGLSEVAIKIVYRRIDRLRHGVAAIAEMQ